MPLVKQLASVNQDESIPFTNCNEFCLYRFFIKDGAVESAWESKIRGPSALLLIYLVDWNSVAYFSIPISSCKLIISQFL
jgi:hypothetical protein